MLSIYNFTNSWVSDGWLLAFDKQFTVVGAVVYNSYGARLFTVQYRPPRHASVNMPKRTERNNYMQQ